MIVNLILFILILGVIVFVHEGGHFLFAKLFGVHVYEFSIGMGPVLLKKTAKDGTNYCIRAIPIGGFVSLAGEEIDPEELKKTKGKNLQDKPAWQRFLIMFMGVGNNFIFAFLILLVSGLIWGSVSTKPVISNVTDNMPAALAGVSAGDTVKSINGKKVKYMDDISLYLTVSDLSKEVELTVIKESKEEVSYTIKPEKIETDGEKRYALGIELSPQVEKGFGKSISNAFKQEGAIFKQMFVVIKNLFTGGVKVNQLSGPVGIYSIVGDMKSSGINALLMLTALLSINVGVINLLPFPAFDGGRILFLIIEKIKGSPVNSKVENTIHAIGFILLIILMIYITFNDILKLF